MRVFIILAIVLSFATAHANEVYTWEDAEGIHFVDDFSKVPKQYQKNIKRRSWVNSNSSTSTPNAPPERQYQQDQEARQRAEAEASAKQFKNRIDLEMKRLQSEKDALRGSPFVDKSIDNQMEKLKNNPEQYFYDEEQRQKNKVPVIYRAPATNTWR